MQNKKPLIIVAVIAVVALAAAVYYHSPVSNTQSSGTTIKVAANFPLSGELAYYGEEIRDGLLMAVAEKGDQLPKTASISFDWGDNRFSPKDAATVMQRQLLTNPTIYTSALKPEVVAIEKEVGAAGIPHLAWVLDLTPNPAGTTNNFRTWVSFKLECDVFFEYAKQQKGRKVVLSYVSLASSEEAYGKYLADRLKKELGCDVVIERYTPDVSPDDFKNIAVRIAANSPDLIMINGFIPQMVGIIRGLRPLGAIKGGNTMAALDMLDAARTLAPEETEGIVVAAPPFLIAPTDAQKAWMARFEQKYSRKPAYHAAFAYDAGLSIIDAAGRLKLPAGNKEWLAAILATKIDGVTGPIRFGEDQSQITELRPAVYKSGALVPLQ